jgi:formamidopyrimidine-DNA glycosylase
MPELPEVETVVRSLKPIIGCRIEEARFFARRIVIGSPQRIAAHAQGAIVRGLSRMGKHIVLELDSGLLLLIHLGMTGKLLLTDTPGPYTRARFALSGAALSSNSLCYDDIRMFGRIELADTLPARLRRLGPEPLAISFDEFLKRLHMHRSQVKPLLLNQSFVRGMGNIYTDEALFRARIHPCAIASRLSCERARRLHQAMVEVLTLAIERGGSSISDYVDADGRKGWFQLSHQVYQKTGEPCPRCSTPIRRMLVAQRGTHYCPKCQRR